MKGKKKKKKKVGGVVVVGGVGVGSAGHEGLGAPPAAPAEGELHAQRLIAFCAVFDTQGSGTAYRAENAVERTLTVETSHEPTAWRRKAPAQSHEVLQHFGFWDPMDGHE